jgi:hypothetical protein
MKNLTRVAYTKGFRRVWNGGALMRVCIYQVLARLQAQFTCQESTGISYDKSLISKVSKISLATILQQKRDFR